MKKFRGKWKKVSMMLALTTAVGVSLSGCSSDDAGSVINVINEDLETHYLRVNDTNAVCFIADYGASRDGKICDFSDITIPNGISVVELNDENPRSEDWRLYYLVDLKNETSECISYEKEIISCNFQSDMANGSFGIEQ